MAAYSLVIATRKSYKFPEKVADTMSSVWVTQFYLYNVGKVFHSVSGLDVMSP